MLKDEKGDEDEEGPQFVVSHHSYGSGAFGTVLRGRDQAGQPVAIKCMKAKDTTLAKLKNEVAILRSLSAGGGCPNIAAFRAFFPHQTSGVGTDPGVQLPDAARQSHMLVMEAVDGCEAYYHLKSHGPLSERVAAQVMRQVCSALHFAHSRGIVHLDIKLENMLLVGDPSGLVVKLIDWGLAHQHAVVDGSVVPARLRFCCGSRYYASPEMFVRKGYCGFAADMWSVGVCLYAMLFGSFPFETSDRATDRCARSVCAAQQLGESTVSSIFASYGNVCRATPAAVALLDKVLLFDPAKRLRLGQLYDGLSLLA